MDHPDVNRHPRRFCLAAGPGLNSHSTNFVRPDEDNSDPEETALRFAGRILLGFLTLCLIWTLLSALLLWILKE
jgi:hypothetical protein